MDADDSGIHVFAGLRVVGCADCDEGGGHGDGVAVVVPFGAGGRGFHDPMAIDWCGVDRSRGECCQEERCLDVGYHCIMFMCVILEVRYVWYVWGTFAYVCGTFAIYVRLYVL